MFFLSYIRSAKENCYQGLIDVPSSQESAIWKLIILLMMPRGLDPGLAADVAAGQPVIQLLLFFLTLLKSSFPLFSLLEFLCFGRVEAPAQFPTLQVHFPALISLSVSGFFFFLCFTGLGVLSLPSSASSVYTVAKNPGV